MDLGSTTPGEASEATRRITQRPCRHLDPQDFERVRRGLIAQIPDGRVSTDLGIVWDMSRYDFIAAEPINPDTVHPSLWRQAQLNCHHGLFEVTPGIWQARGYDISNITFVAGRTGWIVIDPLTAAPSARACLDLANEHLGARPVVAVIYTHSHADHFGGVHGVTCEDDVAAGRCQIIAPEHFMRETLAENVIAGPAMVRRAHYQFGVLLPPGPRTHVDSGLGKAIPFWPAGLIAPTHEITRTGEQLEIDGVRIEFQLTPESEAPAEMNFFFPDHAALCMAENCSHTMHNLIPIRGAQARDALGWSKYIDEAITLYGDRTEVMFTSHHWPRWGGDDVHSFLVLQRDLYRWVHDQTMRYANHGLNATEIAELLEFPAEFDAEAHTSGYYGHLVHNVKAVYQRYLSWYDGNPANLWRLPPVAAGERYVHIVGGSDAMLDHARRAVDDGEYRWAAELLNHLVFAEPDNTAARLMQAAVFEQLGYQSESATYRNAYLTGAQELRAGRLAAQPIRRSGYLEAMTTEQVVDSIAVRLRAEELGGARIAFRLVLTDRDERWLVEVSHRTLQLRPHGPRETRPSSPEPACTVATTRPDFIELTWAVVDLDTALAEGRVHIEGDPGPLRQLLGHLDQFLTNFALVEP